MYVRHIDLAGVARATPLSIGCSHVLRLEADRPAGVFLIKIALVATGLIIVRPLRAVPARILTTRGAWHEDRTMRGYRGTHALGRAGRPWTWSPVPRRQPLRRSPGNCRGTRCHRVARAVAADGDLRDRTQLSRPRGRDRRRVAGVSGDVHEAGHGGHRAALHHP